MPKKSDTSVPDIPSLIRRTTKLRRDLSGLLQRFPEDHLDAGERIFLRLLNPLWRNQIGDLHGPYERKKAEAVRWIEQYGQYLRDVEACISNVMLKPELFRCLPLQPYIQWSASECIRKLALQEAALKRIQSEGLPALKGSLAGCRRDLRKPLSAAVDRFGIKYCAGETGLHPDTVADIVDGRVERPRTKTRAKVEELLAKINEVPKA